MNTNMENETKKTGLEWSMDFYTRHEIKFEIHVVGDITEMHIWHESMWSNEIVKSIDHYDKNGKAIYYGNQWCPK